MNKRLVLLILVFLMSVVPAASGMGAARARETLLRDGFALIGIDGKLVRQDGGAPIKRRSKPDWCGSGWFFELDSDVSDYRARARSGTKLELLPSSALEKMIADANERSAVACRLWGWTTKYKGNNYIFPNYFLPIGKISRPQSQTPQKAQQKGRKPTEGPSAKEDKRQPVVAQPRRDRPAVSEPNDLLTIPREVMDKLKASKIVRPKQLSRAPQQNSILADRSAFLDKQSDGRPVFVLDALGRNVKPVSLRLLPCEVLELAEQRQSAVPEPVRFKIAGIMTKYKGKNYLLLQKATRVYSHQNFDR